LAHPARHIAPLLVLLISWSALSERHAWAGDRLLSASQAEIGNLVVTPAAVLMSGIAARQVAVGPGNYLLSPSPPVQRLRLVLVAATGAAWLVLVNLAVWIAIALVSLQTNALGRPYLVPLVVSSAAIALGSLIGAIVGAYGRRLWSVIAATVLSYVALAAWAYVPSERLRVLIPRSWQVFDALPIPGVAYALLQVAWLLVLGAALLWFVTTGPRVRWRLMSVTAAFAAAMVLAAGAAPAFVPRQDRVAMGCSEQDGVRLCLWADHEYLRADLQREVALAQRLGRGLPRFPDLVTETDFGVDDQVPPAAAEGQAARTAGASGVAEPLLFHLGGAVNPRRLAGLIIGYSLAPSPTCPDLVFDEFSYLSAREVVASVVETGAAPWQAPGQAPASDEDLARWVRAVQQSMDQCDPLPSDVTPS